jgi:hypothetical protein
MIQNQDEEVEITPQMQAALDELQGMIAARFPDATFVVQEQYDPPGIALVATVDIDDTDEIIDVIGDRLVDLQVYESLPVYVIPSQPIERVRAQFREQQARLAPFLPTG